MFHAVSEAVILTPILAMFGAACMVRSFRCPTRWCQTFVSAAAMAVAGIANVAVMVAVGSPGVVVSAAKDVLTVKAKVAPMPPHMIRRVSWAEAIVRSAGRPCAAIDVAMNGRATVAIEVNVPKAPLLRSREVSVDSVGIVCPEMILVKNTFASCLSEQARGLSSLSFGSRYLYAALS